jgi:predicted nucleic acid-binding protein
MKYLADTSVWIEHLRKPLPGLSRLLELDQVVTHPAIIGELACGNIRKRDEFLGNLKLLDRASEAATEETLEMIEINKLHGKGLGWVDCQLLASSMLGDHRLLTLDRSLKAAAKSLKLSGDLPAG